MNKETGGPAFPVFPEHSYSTGMTLRDYFAAKAMQGIVHVLVQGIRPSDVGLMAADSYAIADAMLKAREQA
jgi:hypothetical protein